MSNKTSEFRVIATFVTVLLMVAEEFADDLESGMF
jgi:hypothetical protein